jgi:predicted membrane channel-forming protein YqfA (hemolysin III family)
VQPAARVGLGIAGSLLGFVFGVLGIILLSFWVFTDHKAAYANANIFLLAPWSVLLAGYGIGAALGRPAATRKAFWLVAAAAGFAAIGVLAKVLPGLAQDNLMIGAFLLPVWLGLAVGFRGLTRSR